MRVINRLIKINRLTVTAQFSSKPKIQNEYYRTFRKLKIDFLAFATMQIDKMSKELMLRV